MTKLPWCSEESPVVVALNDLKLNTVLSKKLRIKNYKITSFQRHILISMRLTKIHSSK